MPDVDVLAAPALARIPDVELMHTGTWPISTGVATFTTDDLSAAVAATGCPAVRRPVLKLGHTDPRFDGEPAVGYVDGLAVAEGGRTLVGDYAGLPGWLGDVIASAYPDRSVEGQYDFRCQLGHTHPFVLTAVALLGVTAPGIGTLASLQDVAALYGVVAASATAPEATPVAVNVTASAIHDQEVTVPNPTPLRVAASVTSEDVRRAYYAGAGWDVWIEEMQLDPMQLIVIDDSTGVRSRVPVVVGEGDGEDAVTFGAAVPVVIRYEDVPAADDDADSAVAAAAAAPQRLVWASRAESRPQAATATVPAPTPPSAPAAGPSTTPNQERSPVVPNLSDEQLNTLRQTLGLAEDADEALILQTMQASLPDTVVTPPAPTVTPGTVVLDEAAYTDLVAAGAAGREARAQQLREQREGLVGAAVRDGRIAPVRRDDWLRMLEADPGSEAVLASLKPGLVPVTELGGAPVLAGAAGSDPYEDLFGSATQKSEAR